MGADTEGEGCQSLEETLEDKLESFLRAEDLAGGTPEEISEEELEDSAQEEGCAVGGPEETLEEKLESILNDEAFADLLSDPAAVAPDAAPAPAASSEDAAAAAGASSASNAPAAVASSEGVAPVQVASSGDESGDCPAIDVESSDRATLEQSDPYEEAQASLASLADMATLALQLEAMRAILGCEAKAGIEIPDGVVAEDASTAADVPVPRGTGPESARGGAAAEEEADAKRTMVSAKRWDLQRNLFRSLDLDGDGRLSRAELLAFAALAGFDGSEEDWAEDFKDLCDAHAGGDEGGPTLPCFRAMLDDTSDDGFHCTDKELAGLHAKLLRQKTEGAKPRKSMLRKKPLTVPLELLTPGPMAAQPKPQLPAWEAFEPEYSQPEAPVALQESAQVAEGPAPGDAELAADGGDCDPPAEARHDPVEAIDAEEVLRKAWEEREAEGEKLGDSGEEEEEEEDVAVEVWGDPERDSQPAKARGAPGRPSARHHDPRETDVATEAVTEMATEQLEMATEMATELELAAEMATEQLELATEMATEATEAVEVRGSSKRSLPAGSAIIRPVLGDDSTILDELLVQAGVAHLAEEREVKKRGQKRPPQQEHDGRPHNGNAERPTKSGRRGALRGSSATSAPPSADQAEALAVLRQELVQLGTKEAMRDRRAIPELAGRIATVHLPVIGAGRALDAMATTFMRQDVPRPHKLAIMYVFHELLLANCQKSDLVADGAKHFLEPLGQTIAHLPQDKLGPFLKLLGMWAHVYTDRFLKHLRGAWTSTAKAGSGHTRSGSLRT